MAKPTYQPKKRKRATSHGFLLRAKTSAGRKIVRGRRRAGRTRLTV